MAPVLQALHGFAPAAAAALVASAWQGAALAALAGVALRLLPSLSAAARSAIWTGVLAVVVFLPLFHAAGAGPRAAAAAAPIQVAEVWSLALVGVWAAIGLARAVHLAHSAWHLQRLSRRATPVPVAPEVRPLLRAGGRCAQLCVSQEVDRPSVAGFFSPRILLPAGLLARLSGSELEQIVLHEMEHLKRRDDWINLAQKLALVLFPLNPALFWIERRLCLERELACDDGVLRATRARKAYATCLANLAEHSLARRSASLALAAWERQSELARRVHRILFRPARTLGRVQTGLVFGLLAVATVAGAAALVRAPQLVSFAPAAAAPVAAEAALSRPPLVVMTAPGFAGSAAHITLTEARMPGSNAASAASNFRAISAVATMQRSQNRPSLRSVSQRHRMPQPASASAPMHEVSQRAAAPPARWLILTRWEWVRTPARATAADDASEAAPQPVSQQVSQPTFAAVATPNGWIVFQL